MKRKIDATFVRTSLGSYTFKFREMSVYFTTWNDQEPVTIVRFHWLFVNGIYDLFPPNVYTYEQPYAVASNDSLDYFSLSVNVS